MNRILSAARRSWSALKRLLKPPRALRFTRLGAAAVLLALGIGLGAMNTGNNLVYMVFGMMLGFITASGVISEASLRGLEQDWILPPEIHARSAAPLRVILRNAKARLPSFGLEAILTLAEADGRRTALSARFPFIPPSAQRSADAAFVPQRRGRTALLSLEVRTRFPFGFFEKSWMRDLDAGFIVYPSCDLPVRATDPTPAWREREFPVPLKGAGDSFLEVRHFFPGDNPSRISWKISARQARLMVRETEKEVERRVIASLEPVAEWEKLSAEDLERAVSYAASYLCEKSRAGFAVGLHGYGPAIGPSTGGKNLARILRALALFEPSAALPALAGKAPAASTDLLALWKSSQGERA